MQSRRSAFLQAQLLPQLLTHGGALTTASPLLIRLTYCLQVYYTHYHHMDIIFMLMSHFVQLFLIRFTYSFTSIIMMSRRSVAAYSSHAIM